MLMKRTVFALALLGIALHSAAAGLPTPSVQSWESYLRGSVFTREEIDRFLEGGGWATFDSELGYVLGNSLLPWGIDGSSAIETIQSNGARTAIMYADRKFRINTYGDSFTECEQVNDGETWQEYLAAHLGEPIRNFGVGGYGVYQAYRRLLREERGEHEAEYLILTICCDDSTRSLLRSRWADIYQGFRGETKRLQLFHANFWSNVEMDLKSGEFVEKKQALPTSESLYKMTDPKWMATHLRDDLALQLSAYSKGAVREMDRKAISRLAATLDFHFDWDVDSQAASIPHSFWVYERPARTAMQVQAAALLNRYSQRATIFILDKARDFALQNGKKLLIVLNGTASLGEMREKGTREDQELVDYLLKERFLFVDMNEVFLRGVNHSKLSPAEYLKPYLVNGRGHFNPSGNHFIAYSLKDAVVAWLEPKPLPYQQPATREINFKEYLRGGMYQ